MGRAGPARRRDPGSGRPLPDPALGVRRTVLVRAARLRRALQRQNLDARVVPVQRHGDRCPLRRRRVGRRWRRRQAGLGIEHWNGRRWHATPLPDLGVPPGDLLWATISGLADAGPADVWADISTSDGASGNRPGTIILRWNGRAWSRVAFPYAGSASAPVASDGHGGIWLATVSGVGDSAIEWFDHYAGGRWTRVRVPRGEGEQPAVLYLSSMSGTRSLWAAGQVDFADDGEAILTYGGQGTLPRASPGGSERAGQDVGDRRGGAACAADLGPAPVPEGGLGGGGARRELDRGALFGAAVQDELKELGGDALTTPGAADQRAGSARRCGRGARR